jgi:hypothetical protein
METHPAVKAGFVHPQVRSCAAWYKTLLYIERNGFHRAKPALLCGGGHVRARNDRSTGQGSSRPQGTQPARGKPGTRNGKLRPATVQADQNVGRRSHGRMAQRPGGIAVKANLSRNHRERGGLALGADHGQTSGMRNIRETIARKISGRFHSNRIRGEFSTGIAHPMYRSNKSY